MSKKIPVHLQQYIAKQHYRQYTPINHAVWRFVMRQNHFYLKNIAHSAYVKGLKDSGINIESIPRVEEMNEKLAQVGWGAVAIDGLIPGAAFYSFLENRILPIATDIRKIENIAYTPAPDIIHEAAGHAPILLDPSYRDFVKKIGEMGAKALSSKEKLKVFKAIRQLTIVAEDPKSTPEQVREAENRVAEARKKVKGLTEADKVSRLFWWTVEYGLIGDLNYPKIYGAGLLSSVGESQSCLADDVRKIPFSVEGCIHTPYDVTKPQPQLFVCSSFAELTAEIDKFAETMAFRKGGTESLEKALRTEAIATIVFSSGLQVTGTLGEILKDEGEEAVYFRTNGPTALSFDDIQLTGHSTETHRKGFGTPIGRLAHGIVLEDCKPEQLHALGIYEDSPTSLCFESGIKVEGIVTKILLAEGKPILISFKDCTVRHKNQLLFKPDWGTFDMAVGAGITSVFAGAADPYSFFDMQPAMPLEEETVRDCETELESLYESIRQIRESSNWNASEVGKITALLDDNYPKEWLLRLEILELYQLHDAGHSNVQGLIRTLHEMGWGPSIKQLIQRGLELI
ncbi:aromatic amino acid hydroxylase [Neobacillus citreus]|uniref:Aromatic amino acid hydroxylase n=1 Tax=Neobacillus citreus TaxID=2833578 RepID=A0A942T615_9BACI|nr:aromatic amino acid hydroxylase [Neobacillus citreus]